MGEFVGWRVVGLAVGLAVGFIIGDSVGLDVGAKTLDSMTSLDFLSMLLESGREDKASG